MANNSSRRVRTVSTPDNRSGYRRRSSRLPQAANANTRSFPKRLIRPLPDGRLVLFEKSPMPKTFGRKVPLLQHSSLRNWSPKSLGVIFPGINFMTRQFDAINQSLSDLKLYQSGGSFGGAGGWVMTNGTYSSSDYPVEIFDSGIGGKITMHPYSLGPIWSNMAWDAGLIAGQAITQNPNAFPGGSDNNIRAGLWLGWEINPGNYRYAISQSWARNLSEPETLPFYTWQVASNSVIPSAQNWLVNVLPHAFNVPNLNASPYAPPMWMSPHRVNHPAIDPYIGYQSGYDIWNPAPRVVTRPSGSIYKDYGFNVLPRGVARPVIGRNPHQYRTPRKGEKERKVESPVLGKMWGAISTATEGLDILDAAYNALPKSVRQPKPPKYLWGDSEGTAAWRRARNTPQAKAAALWSNWHDVDMEQFARNLIKNHVNDMMWAKMGFKGGPWTGPGWEARINGGGVRQYEMNGATDDLGIKQSPFPLDPGGFVGDLVFGFD